MPPLLRSREELLNSPQRPKVSPEKEARIRNSYCNLVKDAGIRMNIPQLTIATAIVFCHRYYAVKTFEENDTFIIATACLFLAGKVEETMRPVKEIVNMMYCIRYKKDAAALRLLENKFFFDDLKEAALTAERALLYTLGFEFDVQHPYKCCLETVSAEPFALKSINPQLPQIAWNIVNDSLRTTLCLQHEPKDIAHAAVYLGLKLLKLHPQKVGGRHWWEHFGADLGRLHDIMHQIMDLYQQQVPAVAQKRSVASKAQALLGKSNIHSHRDTTGTSPNGSEFSVQTPTSTDLLQTCA